MGRPEFAGSDGWVNEDEPTTVTQADNHHCDSTAIDHELQQSEPAADRPAFVAIGGGLVALGLLLSLGRRIRGGGDQVDQHWHRARG
jgi:hypothetical protein